MRFQNVRIKMIMDYGWYENFIQELKIMKIVLVYQKVVCKFSRKIGHMFYCETNAGSGSFFEDVDYKYC